MQLNARRMNAVYNKVKTRAIKNNPSSITQPGSFLQLEIALQSGKGYYAFAINKNNGIPPIRPSETRLDQNDAFVAAAMGLFIKQENSANPGQGVLQSYPNVIAIPDVAGQVANADLEGVFNSSLSIKVGDVVYGDSIDMRPSRVVRTTQQTTAENKSEQLGMDGLFEVEPFITFDGGQKNDIVLNIANWVGQLIQLSTAGAGPTIYAVLKFYGFLITGGSGIGKVNQ